MRGARRTHPYVAAPRERGQRSRWAVFSSLLRRSPPGLGGSPARGTPPPRPDRPPGAPGSRREARPGADGPGHPPDSADPLPGGSGRPPRGAPAPPGRGRDSCGRCAVWDRWRWPPGSGSRPPRAGRGCSGSSPGCCGGSRLRHRGRRERQPAGIHRFSLGIAVLLLQELAKPQTPGGLLRPGSGCPRAPSTQAVASVVSADGAVEPGELPEGVSSASSHEATRTRRSVSTSTASAVSRRKRAGRGVGERLVAIEASLARRGLTRPAHREDTARV